MTTIKNILRSLHNIYSYVALFLHELSHIILIYVIGSKVKKIDIEKKENCGVKILITPDREVSRYKGFLVSFSPILMIILIGVLAIFSNVFLILFLYTLTNLFEGVALPSKEDKEYFKGAWCGFASKETETLVEYDENEDLTIE